MEGAEITVANDVVVVEVVVTSAGLVTRVVMVTGVEENNRIGLSVYPVPSSDFVNISIENWAEIPYRIDLIDIDGKLLESIKADSKISTIDISEFKNSTYILQISNGKKMFYKRILKY